ncbi:MAG TPA: AAA family ATPase [Natronosporangium sp.]|nr:AAA family ATPase [Natronosporangium sp.]
MSTKLTSRSAPALVGRDAELAALVDVLGRAPAVVIVEGDAGVGKTRLVSEAPTHGELASRRFVVGSCRPIRDPFPLGPVLEAVRELAGELSRARLSPVTGALRPLLPELADVLPPPPPPLDDRAAERHRVFRAVADLLGSVSSAIVVLEDLHWADEQTIDLLRYLLASPPPGLSLVLTFRADEADTGVRALTARLPASVASTHIVLAPMDEEQTGALAAGILGLDRVPSEFAARLCERASGLPLAIEQLLALLVDRGVLTDGGRLSGQMLDDLGVPYAFRNYVLDRVSRLPDGTREVLEVAAVLARPATEELIVRVVGRRRAEVRAGLTRALHSGLLVEQGDAIGFRHALAAQAVHGSIPGPRRRQWHERAAAALAGEASTPLGRVAHHLKEAGRTAEWTAVAERAADQAVELGHDDAAVGLLEDLLRHAPLGPDQRGRIAVKLGNAALQALHCTEELATLLSEALQEDLPRAVRGELRLALVQLFDRLGTDVGRQRALLEVAVEELRDRPELMAHAMLALSLPVVPGLPLDEHTRWLRRVLETLPTVDDPAAQVFLLGKVAMVQVVVGDPQWRELTDRILAMTGGTPRHRREVTAFCSAGVEVCYAGHLATAQQLLTAALEGATATGSGHLQLRARSALALLRYCQGAWDALAGEAESLIDQLADYAPSRADVEVVAGCLAFARGDLDQAAERLGGIVRRLEQRGAFDLLPLPASALIRLAVSRGDTAGALATVRRLRTAMESVPFEVSAARALPAMTEAMVSGELLTEARTLVASWPRKLRGLAAPLACAALPHARGLLDAGEKRWPAAARNLGEAARQYDRLGCAYEAAQAREQAAVALMRCGDRTAAGTELRAAIRTFQRLQANRDLDRASRFAREHAVPVPARHRGGHRGYGASLSPRERQVARLVAAGHTNKEIAVELFLSPETVKTHVQSVMRKLGVRSRVAVARRLLEQ